MTAIPKPPSAHDLLRLASEPGVEFANGHVVEKPVSIQSSRIEARILILLGNEAERTGAGEVFGTSMGYQCYRDDPAKFRKPDVSVVRAERMQGIDPREGLMPIPADLVVEVISPNDLAYDVAEKVEEYLSNGFPVVWVVHPNTRTVMVHRPSGPVAVLHEQDEITAEPALPEFRCKVAEFFVRRT